ncbi:MAG: putative PHD type zinc finger protein with BAH domain-containing protein [Bogoriella megaspora]|nr:MAG: putative PHD type zinc finger protein with BAH domain-containing protein [Bogoriella megaspora]
MGDRADGELSGQEMTAPAEDGPPRATEAAPVALAPSTDASLPSAQPSEQLQRSPAEDTLTRQSSVTAAGPLPENVENSPMEQDQPTSTEPESISGPTPYGTRSRNRTTARINYAEEPDIDVDGEFSRSSGHVNGSKHAYLSSGSGSLSPAMDEDRLSPPSAMKPSTTLAHDSNDTQSTMIKIPGTSTFSATPDASSSAIQSKKRKATGNHGYGQAAASTSTHAAPRKPKSFPLHSGPRETNMLSFENTRAKLNKNGSLVADDGTSLSINEHVYLVCEPPGDPYYLGRIMEFLHTVSDDKSSSVDRIRINWFYRPRDVQRYNADSRLLYMTMHSDACPITSLRGKCHIQHRSEIDDIDEYRKQKDSFWWNQLFDRFIRRWYECVPTKQIINVPEKVKKALDERWKFVAVEMGRVKELTSAVKLCKRCSQYCASQDSVDCALCRNTWHLNCVRPPLVKKPARGFAWSCAACARAQEKKLKERHTPAVGEAANEAEEEEIPEEEEGPGTLDSTRAPSPDTSAERPSDNHPGTQAEIAVAQMWPVRYLGIHCRVEDALQYDDRAIYPRASSRLGPRHQANVNVWHGHPVEFVKQSEIKKRYVKNNSHKKDAKLSREILAALEADRDMKAKRPKWVMDEPLGYVHRGEQRPNNDSKNTAQLRFSMNAHSSRGEDDGPLPLEPENRSQVVDQYMVRAKSLAKDIGVESYSTNFLDKALQLLMENNYNVEPALQQLKKVNKVKDLKEVELSKEELKKFEEGVARYGSEHRLIKFHMKTSRPTSDIIRFYYMWKKSPKGQEIWGSYDGRKGVRKRMETDTSAKLADDVADSHDDSAFDGEKATKQRRGFHCKFCLTRKSRQWRRAPAVAPGSVIPADPRGSNKDKANQLVLALCQRCAMLWRKYAVKWENLEELQKKLTQTTGGRAWKRKYDEELLNELAAANESARQSSPELSDTPGANGSSGGEPARKKSKLTGEKEAAGIVIKPKEKPAPPPRPPTPPLVPEQPKFRDLACAVCYQMEPTDLESKYRCVTCAMTVHRNCYGITENRNRDRWEYVCRLCPIHETRQDLVAPPKQSHKKKTDREREKERLEKELADKFRQDYVLEQRKAGRPEKPREPLKQTHQNNWVHITCSTWMPELKFSNAKTLEKVEGFGSIPLNRFESNCKVCLTNQGACILCHKCHSTFHVECAHQMGFWFSFDVQPVKGSRKDAVGTITLGEETGTVNPVAWCDTCIKSKDFKHGILHQIQDVVDDKGTTALQIYVQNFKQADLTLTGTVRKASLAHQSAKALPQVPVVPPTDRRVSLATGRGTRSSIGGRSVSEAVNMKSEDIDGTLDSLQSRSGSPAAKSERICVSCRVGVSPKWWKADAVPKVNGLSNGHAGDVRVVNGTLEHDDPTGMQPSARVEAMATTANAALVENDAAVPGPDGYLCHKCYSRRKRREPTPPPREEKTPTPIPDPFAAEALPPRPPTQERFVWPHTGAPPTLTTPGWMLAQPPHGAPLTNGHGLGPAGYPGPGRHPYSHNIMSPRHAPQMNGHIPQPPPLHMPNGIHSQPRPASPGNAGQTFIHNRPPPLQPPTTTSNNAPAPTPFPQHSPSANGYGNGASPHAFPLTSPQRNTNSPFGVPPPGYVPATGASQGTSPGGFGRRPSTPGSGVNGGNATNGGPGGQGASASPNLRNLLH